MHSFFTFLSITQDLSKIKNIPPKKKKIADNFAVHLDNESFTFSM